MRQKTETFDLWYRRPSRINMLTLTRNYKIAKDLSGFQQRNLLLQLLQRVENSQKTRAFVTEMSI